SGKKPLVRYWMHTGFLNVRGEKMAKSLGNFTTIRDMLREYEADAFRFFVLLAHYRSPIDFSEEALEQARNGLERIRQAAKIIEEQLEKAPESTTPEGMDPAVALAKAKFLESMDNDFNTPYALRAVFDLVRGVNRRINEKNISQKGLQDASEQLQEFGEILGLSFHEAGNRPDDKTDAIAGSLIELLIETRQKLRDKKEWQLADEIRARLRKLDIVIEDA
ncbi:MAG: DALR domain-containing protein, partial [Halobacteriota archaeon]